MFNVFNEPVVYPLEASKDVLHHLSVTPPGFAIFHVVYNLGGMKWKQQQQPIHFQMFPSHCDDVRVDLLSPTFCFVQMGVRENQSSDYCMSQKLWITPKHRSGEISNAFITRISHQYIFPSKHPRIPVHFTRIPIIIKYLKSDSDRMPLLQILLNKVSQDWFGWKRSSFIVDLLSGWIDEFINVYLFLIPF